MGSAGVMVTVAVALVPLLLVLLALLFTVAVTMLSSATVTEG